MEVEVKIPISKEDFDRLKEHSWCNLEKTDRYFSLYSSKEERLANKEPVIRIRDNWGSKFYFTFKQKSTENGIEANKEYETLLPDPKPIIKFLETVGYKQWFTKKKTGFVWKIIKDNQPTLTCEPVCVNGLYYFEIEAADYDGDKNVAIELIKQTVKDLGLDFEKRDERPWPTILENQIATEDR